MLTVEFKGADVMIQGLRDAPMRLQKQVVDLFEKTAFAIKAKAVTILQTTCKKPAGGAGLAGSVQVIVRSRDPLWVEVGPHKEYAEFVERGTRPHMIYPRNKTVLRWKNEGGRWVYSKYASHPGMKPKWYMRDAITPALARMSLLMAEIMEKAFGK